MALTNETVRDYYQEMTEPYLRYGGETLAWHIGLAETPETTHEEALLRANDFITSGLGLGPESRVVDAGCGAGGLAFYIAGNFGARVLGLTLCEEHVRFATEEAARRGLSHLVEFRVHDFMEPLDGVNEVDAVLSQDAFCHARDAGGFLRNVRAMLRPGGTWRAVDAFYTQKPGTGREDAWGASIRDGWKVDRFFSVREVQETAMESGFRGISFLDVSTQAYASARGFLTAHLGLDILDQLGARRPEGWVDRGAVFKSHMAANAAWAAGLLAGDLCYGRVEAHWVE